MAGIGPLRTAAASKAIKAKTASASPEERGLESIATETGGSDEPEPDESAQERGTGKRVVSERPETGPEVDSPSDSGDSPGTTPGPSSTRPPAPRAPVSLPRIVSQRRQPSSGGGRRYWNRGSKHMETRSAMRAHAAKKAVK